MPRTFKRNWTPDLIEDFRNALNRGDYDFIEEKFDAPPVESEDGKVNLDFLQWQEDSGYRTVSIQYDFDQASSVDFIDAKDGLYTFLLDGRKRFYFESAAETAMDAYTKKQLKNG